MRLSILGEVPPDSFRGIVVAWTDCLPCVNVSRGFVSVIFLHVLCAVTYGHGFDFVGV